MRILRHFHEKCTGEQNSEDNFIVTIRPLLSQKRVRGSSGKEVQLSLLAAYGGTAGPPRVSRNGIQAGMSYMVGHFLGQMAPFRQR